MTTTLTTDHVTIRPLLNGEPLGCKRQLSIQRGDLNGLAGKLSRALPTGYRAGARIEMTGAALAALGGYETKYGEHVLPIPPGRWHRNGWMLVVHCVAA